MEWPVPKPLKPMLAKRATKIPSGEDWTFEPKWDGFRTIVFFDGTNIELQSRDLKPLARYFPELVAALREVLTSPCVLDGEIVIVRDGALDFSCLQQRIHPAESRIQKLSQETPASVVFWEALAVGDRALLDSPLTERRAVLHKIVKAGPRVLLTPVTEDRAIAADWFSRFEGAGFDGIIAKSPDLIYQPNKRAMVKVKHQRTVDCVVGGFRWHKNGPGTHVGSLLLGLYDDAGVLHHLGVAASFRDQKRLELAEMLGPEALDTAAAHPWRVPADEASTGRQRLPGGTSRWSKPGGGTGWEALSPSRVCEVTYDHVQGGRFRHTAHFKRWRVDKAPEDCTYGQVEVVPPAELRTLFS